VRHNYLMRVYILTNLGMWLQYITFIVFHKDVPGVRFPTVELGEHSPKDFPASTVAHLEEIILGYQGESGALLYLNDDIDYVRTIARSIISKGRSSILLTYFPEDIKPNEFYSAIGKSYPTA
jgi:hypothetical protein